MKEIDLHVSSICYCNTGRVCNNFPLYNMKDLYNMPSNQHPLKLDIRQRMANLRVLLPLPQIPRGCRDCHHEVELGVVVGARCRDLPADPPLASIVRVYSTQTGTSFDSSVTLALYFTLCHLTLPLCLYYVRLCPAL